jgi:hypothetical protein
LAEMESREDVAMPRACGGNRSAVTGVRWWLGITKCRAAKRECRGWTPGDERDWRSGRKSLAWMAELLVVLKSAHRLHGCMAARLLVLLKSTLLGC